MPAEMFCPVPGVKDAEVMVCLVIVCVISTLVSCDARVLGEVDIGEYSVSFCSDRSI